jgi:hypothetical protein
MKTFCRISNIVSSNIIKKSFKKDWYTMAREDNHFEKDKNIDYR